MEARWIPHNRSALFDRSFGLSSRVEGGVVVTASTDKDNDPLGVTLSDDPGEEAEEKGPCRPRC